jgi:hypothetical protein
MTTHDPLLPAVVLQRKAVVYVRQSTPQQVQLNLESQRRQYELVEVARRRGFTNIEVIDDDLGRTASGAVERPGLFDDVEQIQPGPWVTPLVWVRPCWGASTPWQGRLEGPQDLHNLQNLQGKITPRATGLFPCKTYLHKPWGEPAPQNPTPRRPSGLQGKGNP